MQKKGKERKPRSFLTGPPALLVVILGVSVLSWLINRDSAGSVLLSYGELMQILQADDPSVKFQKVRASPTEVRGEIVTSDTLTESTAARCRRRKRCCAFRTAHRFRDGRQAARIAAQAAAGSEFVREDDESIMRVVSSLFSILI